MAHLCSSIRATPFRKSDKIYGYLIIIQFLQQLYLLRVYPLVIARDPDVAAAQNNPVHKKRPRFLNIDVSHMIFLMTISSYSYCNLYNHAKRVICDTNGDTVSLIIL